MYYTNDQIDKLVKRVEISEDEYAAYTGKSAAKMLDENPLWYKLFGVYWWAVKDAIRKHAEGERWYRGSYDDPLMKERSWHGSEFRTLVAANYYMSAHSVLNDEHIWYDRERKAHEYILIDHDISA